jgi:hypothetical protein
MSYSGKFLLLKEIPYANSLYFGDFLENEFSPAPPATNVYSTEENSGIKKVYVTDDGKSFAII